MQLVDPRAIARGMVRADPGEDLVESLQAVAQAAGWDEAYVTGAGVLDLVEIERHDAQVVTLENAELLSLAGRIVREEGRAVVHLRASVMAGGRAETGRIVAAITGRLLLVVDAVTELPKKAVSRPPTRPAGNGGSRLELGRPGARPETGRPAAGRPAAGRPETGRPEPGPPEAPRTASQPLSQSFSTRPLVTRIASPADQENPAVEPGDFLDHPQLGLCEVVGDDEAGGTRIRVPSGRVRVLRLDALQVLPAEPDAEGRHIFKVVGPRRR